LNGGSPDLERSLADAAFEDDHGGKCLFPKALQRELMTGT